MRKLILFALLAVPCFGQFVNAKKIQGTPVCTTKPTDNQTLVYSTSTGLYCPGASGVADAVGIYTVATLPSSPSDHDLAVVTDANPYCILGGGGRRVLCQYVSGAGWTTISPVISALWTAFGSPNGSDVAPHNMTSNSLPTPYEASASSEYNSITRAYYAFNGGYSSGGDNGWSSADATGWLQIKLAGPSLIGSYTIAGAYWNVYNPRDWTLQGSNDGTTWHVIDTVTGATWADYGSATFDCDDLTTAYQYIRLDITANNGGVRVSVAELSLTTAASTGMAGDLYVDALSGRTYRNRSGNSVWDEVLHGGQHTSTGSDPIPAATATVRGTVTTTTSNSQVVSTDDSRITGAVGAIVGASVLTGTGKVLVDASAGTVGLSTMFPVGGTTTWTAGVLRSGTYTSGLTPTGSAGQYINLTFTDGATARLALTGTNAIAGGTALSNIVAGTGLVTPPTTATVSDGTATATGTVLLATTLSVSPATIGRFLNNLIQPSSLTILLPVVTTAMANSQWYQCFRNATSQTGALTLVFPASTYGDLLGANSSAAGSILSGGALADEICVYVDSTTHETTVPVSGSWSKL